MVLIRSKLNWEKIHRFQRKPGWCGPAVIQMVLRAVGIKKTQFSIAQAVYKPWWGTSQQIIFAYLSKYFRKINFKSNSDFKELKHLLKKGYIIIVDWWDDYDADDPDGHYTIVIGYSTKTKNIKMADPSNEREGIWDMEKDDFQRRWYDTLDAQGRKWINGWMLWVDPKSVIK